MTMRHALTAAGVIVALTLPFESSAQTDKLRTVYDRDMLGAQVTYLEHYVGPAWRIYPGVRIYKVSGCEVTVGVKDNEVRYFHMMISNKCQFDLTKFSNNYKFPKLFGMTFGQFEQPYISGQFQASCLSLCGNAADPVVREFYQGPHAEDFIQIAPEVVLASGAALDAAVIWSNIMQKNIDQDYVIDTKFNCDGQFDAFAHKLFANVPITAITVGYDIPAIAPGCGRR